MQLRSIPKKQLEKLTKLIHAENTVETKDGDKTHSSQKKRKADNDIERPIKRIKRSPDDYVKQPFRSKPQRYLDEVKKYVRFSDALANDSEHSKYLKQFTYLLGAIKDCYTTTQNILHTFLVSQPCYQYVFSRITKFTDLEAITLFDAILETKAKYFILALCGLSPNGKADKLDYKKADYSKISYLFERIDINEIQEYKEKLDIFDSNIHVSTLTKQMKHMLDDIKKNKQNHTNLNIGELSERKLVNTPSKMPRYALFQRAPMFPLITLPDTENKELNENSLTTLEPELGSTAFKHNTFFQPAPLSELVSSSIKEEDDKKLEEWFQSLFK